jgi:hypothetical protein
MLRPPAASGPECVKTPSRTLDMISEDFIAGIAHEAGFDPEVMECGRFEG